MFVKFTEAFASFAFTAEYGQGREKRERRRRENADTENLVQIHLLSKR